MSEGRGRTRTSAAPAGRTAGRTGGGQQRQTDDWGRRGASGRETVNAERAAAAARRNRPFEPFRFFLPKNASTEITILDDSLEDAWYMFEHAIPGPGMDWSKTVHEACPREHENCPICEKAQEDPKGRFGHSVYMTFLSIIENYGDRPYTDKHGVKHYFGKRLLALKPGQLEDYERLFDVIKKTEGTLRGATLIVERGAGDTSPRVGKPVINDNGQMYEMLSEEQLDEYYGNDAEYDEKNQIIKAENDNITAFDYKQFFHKPSAEDLVSRWPQLSVGVGSQADIDRTLRQGEDAPSRGRGGSRTTRVSRGGAEATGTTGARGRGRGAPADYNEDPPEDNQQEEQQTQQSARGRGRAAAPAQETAPPPSRGRGTPATQTRTAETQQRGAGRGAPPSRAAREAAPASTGGRTRGTTLRQDMDDDIPFN